MMELRITGLSKDFGVRRALADISLQANPGEIVAVSGPSGAGKTTLARLISGLERGDAGRIELGSRAVDTLPAQQRRVAHMFESYALYPHLSVYDNVASPLRAPGARGQFTPAEIEARVSEMLELTEISALRSRRPAALSGGQKQRVALCRALVQSPDLFLLDEPIGHLDAKLRHKLRGAIRRRQRALAQPTLWFTPDANEAMAVADRIVMLIDGRIRQVGTPAQIYLNPADVAVARLVGDPAMNLLPVDVRFQTDGLQLHGPGGRLRPSAALAGFISDGGAGPCVLGFAPADTFIRSAAGDALPGEDEVPATTYSVEPFGKFTLVTLDAGGVRLRAKVAPGFSDEVGAPQLLRLPVAQLTRFDATGAWHSTTRSSTYPQEPYHAPQAF